MSQEQAAPQMYTEEQLNIIDEHIEKYFGGFTSVFHEIVSPDIHVDILILEPTQERDYYTLITQGMGAHLMNVPQSLQGQKLTRAELIFTVPKDWQIHNTDETWYWPLRWLKILARLPLEQDTWLGWGHTVPAGEAFAENTQLCGMLLIAPQICDDEEGCSCPLPDGTEVNFYHLIPLYEEEMDYKVEHNADALLDLMDDVDHVLQIDRRSCLNGPQTLKYYRQGHTDALQYSESWWEDGQVVLHQGTVGEKGQTTRKPCADFSAFAAEFAAEHEAGGYIPDYEMPMTWLVLQLPMQPFDIGSAPPREADMALAHKLQDLLGDHLGWYGLGNVDGWEIGRQLGGPAGFVLNIYALVIDKDLGVQHTLAALAADKTIDSHGLKIATREDTGDDDEADETEYTLAYTANETDQSFFI